MEKRKDINYFNGLDEVYVEPMKDGTPMYSVFFNALLLSSV